MPAASLRAAAGAVSFLTRVPTGRFAAVDAADVARGSILFPAVGAAVGALTGGAAALLHLALPAFVAAGALSRGVGVTLAALLPYAQAEAGAGSVLSGRVSPRAALLAGVVAAAGAATAGVSGAWFALAAAVAAVVLGLAYRSWLEGVTGDTLGAATELSELTVVVVAVALA